MAMTVDPAPGHGELLVVPRSPGPLVRLTPAVAERDDLDDVLDDIFGEPLTDGPGAADVVLVLVGIVGVVLGVAGVLGQWAVVAGALAIALGLVLPLRALGSRLRRRSEAHDVAVVLGTGTPLDTSAPAVAALAAAYSRLLDEAEHGGPSSLDARDLGHQTVLEVATLLRGRPPRGDAEREFVRTRADALGGLVEDLAAARDDGSPLDAGVAALERVDELNGSVRRIDALRESLRGEQR